MSASNVSGIARERVAAAFARVDAREAQLHALISQSRDDAYGAADQCDARTAARSTLGALDGVTVVVKDNIDIAGLPTSVGIGHYRDAIANADAPVVAQLKAAGAVIIGKANLHEAALGATSDNPWFGRCDNPLRAGYTPGGSSGGSAAAVAAGYCELALGTDTMGSVRIPAAYCGVAGFKPTRGALSTAGVVPLSAELDHVGLLAANAAAISRAWYALRGIEYTHTALGFKGRRVGILPGLLGVELGEGVSVMLRDAQACVRDAGAALVEAQLPGWDTAQLRRESFLLCEIDGAQVHAASLARDPEGFSTQLRSLFAYGSKQDTQRRVQIVERLRRAGQQLADLLGGLDLLLLPTCPQAAFAHGAPVPVTQADFTVPANLAGAPAISLPWGQDAQGLPLGLQLIAKPGADDALLRMAGMLEALRDGR
jgi:aspartyl-tRNA(Asn)/glutamyl-tRNA(Gln) amidotransferase subunit A